MTQFLKRALILLFIGVYSCADEQYEEFNITYSNDLLFYDNSSRIEKNLNRDQKLIYSILDQFETNQRNTLNSRDAIHIFSVIDQNNCSPLHIDLNNDFKTISERQKFIMNKSDYNLSKAIANGKEFIECLMNNPTSGKGFDLISRITLTLDANKNFIKSEDSNIVDNQKFHYYFRNRLIIITDGYLEYVHKGNAKNIFGREECQNVRKLLATKYHGKNVQYLIENDIIELPTPISSVDCSKIQLVLLETTDRKYNFEIGTQTESPSDNEILKQVWTNWAKQSKFKEPVIWRFNFIETPTPTQIGKDLMTLDRSNNTN